MEASPYPMANGAGRPSGVFTRSVIKSPVIKFLLHARLRHKSLNDVVFVGDNFIHVKQIGRGGHLEHIASKEDFDASIRAAKVFSNDADPLNETLIIKTEEDGTSKGSVAASPPDFLVLTLTTNDMLFIYIDVREDGYPSFVQQACPLPIFDRILFQPGTHLAVDPHSRALAVAANEREVIIYSAKKRERIGHEVASGYPDWCPVSAQRPLQVEGVILHLEFLIPPDDDEDHIILLLIVIDQRRTRAIHIDWYYTSDLHHAHIHPAQSLSSARTVPNLLVPLRNAAFMMITGSEVRKYKDILTGPVVPVMLSPLQAEPAHSGNSPLQPMWTSWFQPRRSRTAMRNKDHVYLVREDGLVFLIVVFSDINSLQSSSAGHFQCHVGTAFASLGDTGDPDVLAVAGDLSTGRVVSIGHWPSTNGRVSDLSWTDTMEMELIETMPNWASVTDVVTSTLPQSRGRSVRSRNGVFVTSGRQPYGAITELRYGLEARLSAFFELEDSHVISAIWALPVASTYSILVLMSTPLTTRFWVIEGDFEGVGEVDAAQVSALEADHRTVSATVTTDGHIVQVTEKSICVTAGLMANFEDTVQRHCEDAECIVAAAVVPSHQLIFTAETSDGQGLLRCTSSALEATGADGLKSLSSTDLPSVPLALAAASDKERVLAVVATAAHGLLFFNVETGNELHGIARAGIPNLQGCDHVLLLRSERTTDTLIVCGLRDGGLFTALLDGTSMRCTNAQTRSFGQSTVRLIALAGQPSQACAMSGSDTCLLSWDGRDAQSLRIENIWVSDKLRPELAQGPMSAVCHMPAADFLASPDVAGSIAMVSSDEFLVASVEPGATTVPRHVTVSGTPNRVLYSEQHRCLVASSLQTAIRSFPTPHARPEERRQIWPAIDFIPAQSNVASCTHSHQPGDRVYALLEWSFRKEDKTYAFILVGGSYQKKNGSSGGKVSFLQPSQIHKDDASVTEAYYIKFEAPVYSLALYDELTYVACYGQQVCLYSFSADDRKWKTKCTPKRLASPGVSLTVNAPMIYISTAEDSLVTLKFDPDNRDNEDSLPQLVDVSAGPQAANALSHVIVHPGITSSGAADTALMSTKDGRIVGLAIPSPTGNAQPTRVAADTLFTAQLPHSLTRLRQADIRPRWRQAPPAGVIVKDLIGVATDGTLVGIALLDEQLQRRLSWLQRLCEWSSVLSPHSYELPLYFTANDRYAKGERALPIGLSRDNGGSEVMLRTSIDKHSDRHIDGDILARLLERGGAETLRRMLQQTAERDDQVGSWVHDHLEEELEAVDEIIEILRKVLDCWL